MSKRLSPGVLEQMFASGELERRAREMPADATQSDFARSLGISPDAYVCARIRWRKQGKRLPSFEELRAPTNLTGTSSKLVDTDREESEPQASRSELRRQSIQRGEPMPRWPNVEAFERGVDAVPDGHAIKGVSSYMVDGEIRGQWIKTAAQNDDRTAWLTAIREMEESLPRCQPVEAPAYNDDDLLAVYPVGDPHVGLLSWREDSGENFDLHIAEQNLVGAFQHLTALAPAASEALLVFIGDNTHADGQQNTTTKGTRVDVDGRTVKMARTIVRICRHAIDLALTKHGRVTMIVERGNHDELISAMLALALSVAYEREPRVTIDTSPEMFHWFRWGANLIGTHHGDKVKPMDLLGVMAVDRQQDWGETKHRRFYCGHYHHQIVKEVPGLIVEYLPTLASSDAWHRSMGYRSGRAMYMDVLHREWGHINRHIVGVQQLRAA